MKTVLVVDDDTAIREMASMALEKSGFAVVRAASAAEAAAALARARPDLVLCDIYMPGGDGLSVLAKVRLVADPPPVILMTARGSVETAAEAARVGAFDYLAKPFDLSHLVERARAAVAAAPVRDTPEEDGPASLIVGSHPAIVDVYKAVARVARLKVPVLVLGETGTGKELVARALHLFSGRTGAFVPVHCGAIPDTLLESELFGHRKGAFTDASRDRRGSLPLADSGTAFFDEAGEVSPAFQVKLLRFLEDGHVTPLGAERGEPVDARVVCATHRDLPRMVEDGRFRQDLYFRLAGYEIRIPPLRERLSDLPRLVEHFRARLAPELGRGRSSPASEEFLARLARHPWPGNVRELAHTIRRVLIDAGSLEDPAAADAVLEPVPAAGASSAPPASATLTTLISAPPVPLFPSLRPEKPLSLEEAERIYVLSVLEFTGGNKSEAARLLGIERKTLARKLKPEYPGLPDDDEG